MLERTTNQMGDYNMRTDEGAGKNAQNAPVHLSTILFKSSSVQYEAEVTLSGGVLSVSVHRPDIRDYICIAGELRTHWQRMMVADDLLPLGVVRRPLRIDDAELEKARMVLKGE